MPNPSNKGKPWTSQERKLIRDRAKQGTSTPDIAKELKRTEPAVRQEAAKQGIPLKPKDK